MYFCSAKMTNMKEQELSILNEAEFKSKIHTIRGIQVMLDFDFNLPMSSLKIWCRNFRHQDGEVRENSHTLLLSKASICWWRCWKESSLCGKVRLWYCFSNRWKTILYRVKMSHWLLKCWNFLYKPAARRALGGGCWHNLKNFGWHFPWSIYHYWPPNKRWKNISLRWFFERWR